MAHVQDRWWRDKKDPNTSKVVIGENGKPEREKTPLYGTGDRYRVRYLDPDGVEKSKSFPDKQLGRAREFKTKMENDVLAGVYLDPEAGKITLREYAELYCKGRSQDESTQAVLRGHLEWKIYPFMGARHLDNINVDVIRNWLAWMTDEEKSSINYQAHIWDTLSSILDAAVSEGRMRSNPCASKAISAPRAVDKKIVPWTEARLNRIRLALDVRHAIVVPLGAGLGLRQGEIFAFSMDCVDREKLIYHCRRQMVTINGVRSFKLPKGHKVRDIPLAPGILEVIDAYAEQFDPVPITLPWAERDGKKFETVNVLAVNRHGDLYTRQAFDMSVWKKAFRKAGVDHRSWEDGMHALRHLYASHLLAQGVSIRELAEYLGHSSAGFTLRKYAHLMPSSHERARLAVNEMFKPREETSTKDSAAAG